MLIHEEGVSITSRFKLARFFSYIFSAPLMALYSLLVLALFQPGIFSNLTNELGLLFGLLFLTIFPAVPVLIEARRGKVDIFVNNREYRARFFGLALLGYLIGMPIALFYKSRILVFIFLSYLIVTLATAILTFVTKLSVHMAGVTGPITYLVCILGLPFLVLYPFALSCLVVFLMLLVLLYVEKISFTILASSASTYNTFS